MRRAIFGSAIVLLLAGGGYAMRYDYVTAHGQALRVNRFNGETEILRREGWKPLNPRAGAHGVTLTAAERRYLETGQR
jgi:hypothetical protein